LQQNRDKILIATILPEYFAIITNPYFRHQLPQDIRYYTPESIRVDIVGSFALSSQ
jgi:hypothetical protein